VHYGPDVQPGYGLRYYGNITGTRNVSEYMLVFAICLVFTGLGPKLLDSASQPPLSGSPQNLHTSFVWVKS